MRSHPGHPPAPARPAAVVRPPVLALALALLAAACGATGSGGTAASSGGPDPVSFQAGRVGGGQVSSDSLAGRDVALWFWAPWCTVCRGEAPEIAAAARAFAGRVEIVGVAGLGEPAAMEGFVADTGLGDLTHVIDADGSIWAGYGVLAQPAFAFLDDGGGVEVVSGRLDERALTERLEHLAGA